MEMTDDVKEFINIARWTDDNENEYENENVNENENENDNSNEDNILTVRTIIL